MVRDFRTLANLCSTGWWGSKRKHWFMRAFCAPQLQGTLLLEGRWCSTWMPVCYYVNPSLWKWCYHRLCWCIFWKPSACQFWIFIPSYPPNNWTCVCPVPFCWASTFLYLVFGPAVNITVFTVWLGGVRKTTHHLWRVSSATFLITWTLWTKSTKLLVWCQLWFQL